MPLSSLLLAWLPRPHAHPYRSSSPRCRLCRLPDVDLGVRRQHGPKAPRQHPGRPYRFKRQSITYIAPWPCIEREQLPADLTITQRGGLLWDWRVCWRGDTGLWRRAVGRRGGCGGRERKKKEKKRNTESTKELVRNESSNGSGWDERPLDMERVDMVERNCARRSRAVGALPARVPRNEALQTGADCHLGGPIILAARSLSPNSSRRSQHNMVFCAYCGTMSPERQAFCAQCGLFSCNYSHRCSPRSPCHRTRGCSGRQSDGAGCPRAASSTPSSRTRGSQMGRARQPRARLES